MAVCLFFAKGALIMRQTHAAPNAVYTYFLFFSAGFPKGKGSCRLLLRTLIQHLVALTIDESLTRTTPDGPTSFEDHPGFLAGIAMLVDPSSIVTLSEFLWRILRALEPVVWGNQGEIQILQVAFSAEAQGKPVGEVLPFRRCIRLARSLV